jgi:hypothetical protein
MAYHSNLSQIQRQMQEAKERALESIGIVVRSEAQLRSPVLTGAYRDSHTYVTETDNVIIGNPMEYSIWLELGHHGMQGLYVIENSVMENRPKIKQIIEQEYKRIEGR